MRVFRRLLSFPFDLIALFAISIAWAALYLAAVVSGDDAWSGRAEMMLALVPGSIRR